MLFYCGFPDPLSRPCADVCVIGCCEAAVSHSCHCARPLRPQSSRLVCTYLSRYFGMGTVVLPSPENGERSAPMPGRPNIGVVVVWPHHVGVITARTPHGQWIIHSGNVGGAVRTRLRAVTGAIAFISNRPASFASETTMCLKRLESARKDSA